MKLLVTGGCDFSSGRPASDGNVNVELQNGFEINAMGTTCVGVAGWLLRDLTRKRAERECRVAPLC